MSYLERRTELELNVSATRRLRRLAAMLLVMLALSPVALHAQSGRSRADKTSSGRTSGANRNSSDAMNNGADDEGAIIPGGETIEGDVLRVNTSLVTVPVSVMDRSGKYIPDLSREDFHIFEESIEQRIAYFATVDQPFTVALVIDTSRSTNFRLEDIQDAAIAFVDQLKAEDRVTVISFDDDIRVLTKPTNDRAELVGAIRRTRTGGGTRLYDAVDSVIKQHLKQITGRKAIVLFTDGIDTTSHRATYESTLREAEEFDALVYPVAYDTDGNFIRGGGGGSQWPLPGGRGPVILGIPFPRLPGGGGGGGRGGGGGTSRDEARRANLYLHDLAQKTGGRFYNGNTLSGISQAFAQVAEELRRQYSLGYYPKTPGQAGQRRQIKVRVNQPGLVVLARDSYIYSPKKTDAAPDDQQPFSKFTAPPHQLRETR